MQHWPFLGHHKPLKKKADLNWPWDVSKDTLTCSQNPHPHLKKSKACQEGNSGFGVCALHIQVLKFQSPVLLSPLNTARYSPKNPEYCPTSPNCQACVNSFNLLPSYPKFTGSSL